MCPRLAAEGSRTASQIPGLRSWWKDVVNFAGTRSAYLGALVLVVVDSQVLMVRQAYGQHLWCFPGGLVLEGESPRTAAEREAAEELGLNVHSTRLCGVIDATDLVLFVYRSTLASGPVRLQLSEVDSFAWLTAADLRDLDGKAYASALLLAKSSLSAQQVLSPSTYSVVEPDGKHATLIMTDSV